MSLYSAASLEPSLWLVQYRSLRQSLETVRVLAGAEAGLVDAMQVLWWAMSDDEHVILRGEGIAMDAGVKPAEQIMALRAALHQVVECERAKGCFDGLPFDAYRALLAMPVAG